MLNRRNKAVFPTAESPKKTSFRSRGRWSNSAAIGMMSLVFDVTVAKKKNHRSHVVSCLGDTIHDMMRAACMKLQEELEAFKWAKATLAINVH